MQTVHNNEADDNEADDNEADDNEADDDEADDDTPDDDRDEDKKTNYNDADKRKIIGRKTWNQIWEAALDKLRCTTPMNPPWDWPT